MRHIMDQKSPDVSPLITTGQFKFESRQRANTWPRPPLIVAADDHLYSITPTDADILNEIDTTLIDALPMEASIVLKPLHKNPWGDSSYAELIVKAIESSSDKRMTLAQIYGWIPTHIPYFEDKTIENSAGWKNSIRHNLSLHNCFYRGQNETPGRSSWWMIDSTAKPKKSGRPRTSSMGTVAERPAKNGGEKSSAGSTVYDRPPEPPGHKVSIGEERSEDLLDDVTILCDQACQTDDNSPQSSEEGTRVGAMVVSPIPESPSVFVEPAYMEAEMSQESIGFESWLFPGELGSFDGLFELDFCQLWQGSL